MWPQSCCLCARAPIEATALPLRRFVISFTHWTMQRKGAGIGEPTAPDGKVVDDDPLCLGIFARETPEERSLRKRVFVRDDLPWCVASAPSQSGCCTLATLQFLSDRAVQSSACLWLASVCVAWTRVVTVMLNSVLWSRGTGTWRSPAGRVA